MEVYGKFSYTKEGERKSERECERKRKRKEEREEEWVNPKDGYRGNLYLTNLHFDLFTLKVEKI